MKRYTWGQIAFCVAAALLFLASFWHGFTR
jgi:hypothetical protein